MIAYFKDFSGLHCFLFLPYLIKKEKVESH